MFSSGDYFTLIMPLKSGGMRSSLDSFTHKEKGGNDYNPEEIKKSDYLDHNRKSTTNAVRLETLRSERTHLSSYIL